LPRHRTVHADSSNQVLVSNQQTQRVYAYRSRQQVNDGPRSIDNVIKRRSDCWDELNI
jgi:hypothetical protein